MTTCQLPMFNENMYSKVRVHRMHYLPKLTVSQRNTVESSYQFLIVLREFFLQFRQEHLHTAGCLAVKKSAVYIQTGHRPYLQFFLQSCKNCSLAGQVLNVPVCFAWCSFAWPSGFAAGSYIFSIRFGRNESLAERLIVAAQWCMSVAQTIADFLIIMDAAVRKQAVVEIARPNGVSLICIIIEYAAVCLAVWLIHVCIINARMSRGKDKSSVNVKWNTGAAC